MTLGEPTTASAPSTSGAGVRKPSGPAPRGYTHWDAVHGVWRNDNGEAVKSTKERQAEAARLRYARKKEEEAARAHAAVQQQLDTVEDEDSARARLHAHIAPAPRTCLLSCSGPVCRPSSLTLVSTRFVG